MQVSAFKPTITESRVVCVTTDPRELVTVVEVEHFAVCSHVASDIEVFPRVMVANVVLRQLLSSHQTTCVTSYSSPLPQPPPPPLPPAASRT